MNIRCYAIAATLATCTAIQPVLAQAETMSVMLVAGHPPVFRWVRMLPEAFIPTTIAELEKLGHTVQFSEQYGGAIAGVGEELETTENGLAEIGVCWSLFDPAKLPLQNVTYYTPFVSDDIRAVTELMAEMQTGNEAMSKAWADNGVVYIGGAISFDDYLLMSNYPVTSVEDVAGHKLAAPGPAVNWLSGTGAVGVAGNLTLYYNDVKAGVYDGMFVFLSSAMPGKLYEVAPNVLRAGFGVQFGGALCANEDWWNGLDPEVQQAFRTGAQAAQDWYLDDLETFVQRSLAELPKAGATITNASEDLRKDWADRMDNVAQTWAEELDSKGMAGTETLKLYVDGMRAAGAKPVRDWDKE